MSRWNIAARSGLTGQVSNVGAAGGNTLGAGGSELISLLALAEDVLGAAADRLGGLCNTLDSALGDLGDELVDALGGGRSDEERESEGLELHVGGGGVCVCGEERSKMERVCVCSISALAKQITFDED